MLNFKSVLKRCIALTATLLRLANLAFKITSVLLLVSLYCLCSLFKSNQSKSSYAFLYCCCVRVCLYPFSVSCGDGVAELCAEFEKDHDDYR